MHYVYFRERGIPVNPRSRRSASVTTAHTDTFHRRFVKLVPDERVDEVVEFETDDPAMQGEMTLTYELAEVEGGTEVQAVHDDLPPGLSEEDNETGWRMSRRLHQAEPRLFLTRKPLPKLEAGSPPFRRGLLLWREAPRKLRTPPGLIEIGAIKIEIPFHPIQEQPTKARQQRTKVREGPSPREGPRMKKVGGPMEKVRRPAKSGEGLVKLRRQLIPLGDPLPLREQGLPRPERGEPGKGGACCWGFRAKPASDSDAKAATLPT